MLVIQRIVDLGVCAWEFPPGHSRTGDTCGQVHQSCKAHRSRHHPEWGTPCRGRAMRGQLVCASHGGRATRAKVNAARRTAEHEAEVVLRRRLGTVTERDVRNPVAALARLAGQIDAETEAARAEVAELTELVDHRIGDIDPMVRLYERMLDRSKAILVDMERLGIATRFADIEEATAAAHLPIILGALEDLGIDTPEMRSALATRMRAIDTTAD